MTDGEPAVCSETGAALAPAPQADEQRVPGGGDVSAVEWTMGVFVPGGGLLQCDYAATIISREFLAKEWTKADLRGAWTLQIERKRSVVIPIWFRVFRQDVIGLSAILAHLAGIASKEFETVLNRIQLAVGTGEPARDRLSPLGRKFRQFQEIVGPLGKYKE